MKTVIMPLYGIGDFLMSTPAIRNLKEQTGAEVTCLHMFRTTRDMALQNPNIDENFFFPFLESKRLDGLRFLLGLRGRFDVSINFYPSNRKDYNLAAFLVGAPVRIGHRYVLRDRRELNFLKNRTVLEDDTLHNVEENLRLLDFLGVRRKTPYPLEVHLGEDEVGEGKSWLDERGLNGAMLFGLHPGSSLFKAHARKRWPSINFGELIRRLAGTCGEASFLLFGGPEEKGLKEEVAALSGMPGRVLSVDCETIRQTAAIMKGCSLFVANDSGLMHLAAALQVPTVGIFGPTDPRWLAPWGCRRRVVRLGACGPCFRYSPIPQRCLEGTDFSCIREVDVGEVLRASLSLLEEGRAAA